MVPVHSRLRCEEAAGPTDEKSAAFVTVAATNLFPISFTPTVSVERIV